MDYFFENKTTKLQKNLVYNLNFDAHLHDQVEVVYVIEGRAQINIDGEEYSLKTNDLCIVFPNQIHSYSDSENLKSALMIFSPTIVPEYTVFFASYIPENPIITDSEFDNIFRLILNDGVYDENFNRGMILALISMAFSRMSMKELTKYSVDTLKNILIYIDAHFDEPMSIDTLSENVHISRSHISHIFSDKLKTTFTKYLTAKRFSYACDLLKNSDFSITDAALSAGFGSIRSFNRIFFDKMGVSPKKYRQINSKK